jgi:hypothetical protein
MIHCYPVLDFSHNRRLENEEIERCRRLVAAIERSARKSGSLEDESRWVSPDGRKVYGEVTNIDFTAVDSEFLSRLRMESFVFSGVRLETILGNGSVPHWNDYFSQFFPDESGEAPDWCIPAFKEYTRGLAPEYICEPPLVLGEIGYKVGTCCVNRDIISYQERINLLLEFGVFKRLRELQYPTILEIGAGYGGLAYFIKQIVPQVTYIIVDLPRSLLFSGCYLSVTLPGHPVEVLDGSPCSAGGVWLVVNRFLERLKRIRVDLAINTLSFAEMSPKLVADYASFIAQHLVPDGALFEQNFDNSHFSSSNFSCPAEILPQYFPFRLEARGPARWGKASLWTLQSPQPI